MEPPMTLVRKSLLIAVVLVSFAGVVSAQEGGDECSILYDQGMRNYENEAYVDAAKSFDAARACWLEKTGGIENADTATCLETIGFIFLMAGIYETADEYFNMALGVREDVFGQESLEIAAACLNIADTYVQSGQYSYAAPLYKRRRDILYKTLGSGDDSVIEATRSLALMRRFLGEYDNAKALYKEALDATSRLHGVDSESAAGIMLEIAYMHQDMQESDTALEYLEFALEIVLKTQGPESASAGDIYAAMGSSVSELGRKHDAIDIMEKARAILEPAYGADSSSISVLYNNLGAAYRGIGDYQSAVQYIGKSLQIEISNYGDKHPVVARRLLNMGNLKETLGHFDEAISYYQRSLDIILETSGEQSQDAALAYNNLALVCKKLGDYDKAIEYYEKALRSLLSLFGEQNPDAAVVYDNMGNVYDARGDFAKGLEHHLKAAGIFSDIYGKNHQDTAFAYNNAAASYDMLEEYDKSVKYYEKAIAIMDTVLGPGHPETALMIDNVGAVYRKMGDNAKALENHLAALDIFKKVYGDRHPDTATCYNNVAISLDEMGKDAEALGFFRLARDIWIENFGESHPSLSIADINIGLLLLDLDKPGEAVDAFSASLASMCGGKSTPLPGDCMPSEYVVNAFWYRGRALNRLGRRREAVDDYDHAANALNALRGFLESETSKKAFGQTHYAMYSEGVGVFAALAREPGNETVYERAVQFAENGIGRVFLEMLGRSQASINGGLPDDVIARGVFLSEQLQLALDEVNYENSRPREEQTQDARRAAYSTLDAARDELREHDRMLLEKYPAYAELMHPHPRPLADIRKTVIGPDEAAIEFITGDVFSYALLVTNDRIRIVELPSRNNIENLIKIYRNKLTLPKMADGRLMDTAVKLYDVLLKPLEDDLKDFESLLIIPTGQLYFLPFESLAADFGNGPEFLIQHYNIRYAPSLNVLYLSAQAAAAKPVHTGWIGFGDPTYSDDDSRLSDEQKVEAVRNARTGSMIEKYLASVNRGGTLISRIPATGDEIKAVAALEKAPSDHVNLGLDASEARFKKLSGAGYRVIHIAGHGTLGAGEGFEPAVIFSTVGNTDEDGFLQMSEVFNMKTPSDLVVLSACETGRGNLEEGEGVAGMSRAFFYSGAESLIVSLWSVADTETMQLMVDFYRFMHEQSLSRDKALLLSRRKMASEGKHPFYWAPFIYMGLR
ncbi:tetratricopeptide repeat protein [bacterium]